MKTVWEKHDNYSEIMDFNEQYKAYLNAAKTEREATDEALTLAIEHGFKSLDNSLNLNKENVHICLVDNDNREICQSKKYYLVEPTLTLNNTNYINVKNNINNGVIIFINANAKLEEVILLLKEIKYKDLSVVYLSELISEQNTTD